MVRHPTFMLEATDNDGRSDSKTVRKLRNIREG